VLIWLALVARPATTFASDCTHACAAGLRRGEIFAWIAAELAGIGFTLIACALVNV
jgi:hypothetical protein